ncbi:MAG: ATP synthase F1 subunit epsilon [Deltaproteobacteria bacterium]|nr:MAG: ATP synthase F1 subunit epsilon [Deltaproteobacteria bacterium]
MSETTFRLEIVTPSRQLVSEGVEEVTAPGIQGEFGVLVGHTPYLVELGIGELMYRVGNEKRHLAVRRGFAEVTRDKVTILAEEAEFPAEIDLATAEKLLAEAEEEMKALSVSGESKEYLEAQAKIDRALNQVAVARKHKS